MKLVLNDGYRLQRNNEYWNGTGMDYFFKNMVRKRYGYGTIRKTGRTATDPTRIPKF